MSQRHLLLTKLAMAGSPVHVEVRQEKVAAPSSSSAKKALGTFWDDLVARAGAASEAGQNLADAARTKAQPVVDVARRGQAGVEAMGSKLDEYVEKNPKKIKLLKWLGQQTGANDAAAAIVGSLAAAGVGAAARKATPNATRMVEQAMGPQGNLAQRYMGALAGRQAQAAGQVGDQLGQMQYGWRGMIPGLGRQLAQQQQVARDMAMRGRLQQAAAWSPIVGGAGLAGGMALSNQQPAPQPYPVQSIYGRR